MVTPSPKRSPARIITSPMWIPMRKLMRRSGSRLTFASVPERPAPPSRTARPPRHLRTPQGHYLPPYSLCGPCVPLELVEDCAPLGQAIERADLISAHKAVIALDIRCEDCDEASADCHRVWHDERYPSGTPANRIPSTRRPCPARKIGLSLDRMARNRRMVKLGSSASPACTVARAWSSLPSDASTAPKGKCANEWFRFASSPDTSR
jgi:hypothetical protein